MKEYMLIVKDEEGSQIALFTDKWDKANEMMDIAETQLGGTVEFYERKKDEDGTEQYVRLM